MKLNVVSFNIRYKDDPDGNSVAERAPRLKKILSEAAPDVICMQECTPLWMPHLEADYSGEYEIFNRYRGADQLESCPILWRKDLFDCIGKGFFWYADDPDTESKGWDELYDCYRICLWVKLRHKQTGKCFTCMNTHFGFGETCQRNSVELLYRRSKEISDYPTFAIGDFNIFPHYAAYRQITGYFTDVNMATARDTRNTFHGYTLDQNLDERIDYCFVDDSIKPLIYKRMDMLVDGKFPSDHYGIQCVIQI